MEHSVIEEKDEVILSNLDKIMYPKTSTTKRDIIGYYKSIYPVISTHIKDRPLTLKRYPNGVEEDFFYEKRCPSHKPAWVETVKVYSPKNDTYINFCLVNNQKSLIWLANLASLELHGYLHLASSLDNPYVVVFDLDPGEPADIVQCCEVGLIIKDLLQSLGLQSFPKTSGSKGLQIYLPLNNKAHNFEQSKNFAKSVAKYLENKYPQKVVSNMKKNLRANKILVDWSQNDPHKTTVCPYSLRARQHPSVSTPVSWQEVEAVAKSKNGFSIDFTMQDVLDRVSKIGDIFEPVAKLSQNLPQSYLDFEK